ncbi:DUF4258 domain-containing protein [Geobacter benzoatilyticus]|uniref:DUF4258 domain-containing protein n=1 Tax=Geobacter benzoatilyticus TaxID=2815309 RepID=A0ABX7Q013_9BACT|nr:DUF4258 domain-containing protein [Geobacter benzoatilyticus]QSV44552.1 DUF4258 domain-containing protein [Geobacter benzoatilyticus]
MDVIKLQQAAALGKVSWQRHALTRMLERGISRQMVLTCLSDGDVIEVYEKDKPLPSALLLGFPAGGPLHVVAAYDETSEICYVITVYRPDSRHFEADFKTRRLP